MKINGIGNPATARRTAAAPVSMGRVVATDQAKKRGGPKTASDNFNTILVYRFQTPASR